jgi:DMSO/TMAO reductase YedYZ molybdopterin-dependent catalytic subunit
MSNPGLDTHQLPAVTTEPDQGPRASQTQGRGVSLPPGQHAIDGFPRFGTHLHHPAPAIPDNPAIEVTGAVNEPFTVSLRELAGLPRREITADFHCISGWSATGLRWEGVAFETFYRTIIEPNLRSGPPVTHFVFAGLDGYSSTVAAEDALGADVLLAEHLDGRPLDSDHGAPLRLVSPSQYGFISTKHLCRIEARTTPPDQNYGYANTLGRLTLRGPLFQRHPRSRVWEEERHRHLPGWTLRAPYRLLIAPIRALSARGSRPRA